MLSVTYAKFHISALYAESLYAECRHADCEMVNVFILLLSVVMLTDCRGAITSVIL
jgi:hypothetical protein